jgi:hypothetical protein
MVAAAAALIKEGKSKAAVLSFLRHLTAARFT